MEGDGSNLTHFSGTQDFSSMFHNQVLEKTVRGGQVMTWHRSCSPSRGILVGWYNNAEIVTIARGEM